MGRSHMSSPTLLAQKKGWSPAMGTNAVFLSRGAAPKHLGGIQYKALFQSLHEEAPHEDDKFEQLEKDIHGIYTDFNMCQSCFQQCEAYHEHGCSYANLKAECLPDALLAVCEDCEGQGCKKVVEFIGENAELNATGGDDNVTKVELFESLAWRVAQAHAMEDMDELKTCIEDAETVGLAEKCLATFMHPIPASILDESLEVAKMVGPPACAKSYTGTECSPAPEPEEHGGSCPRGFMCMPDPSECKACACSCNSPSDKLDDLESCMSKAVSVEAGKFCLSTLFAQLPPDFVADAIEKANEPEGAGEHYSQIVEACGGDDNGTEITSSCLEAIEYCVRPIQGHPGTFPEDFTKFQPMCECFKSEEVRAHCGEEEEAQEQCAAAIQHHFTLHVHHHYCLHNTEVACQFTCEWPLPGFFGDLDKEKEKIE
mmetsp:Transcript_131091/g.195367  ORF Transcript_131091/g.195367 Transcript_131091/m.195367 type:complete len:428 (+) Transcript_131091:1-1284(+)